MVRKHRDVIEKGKKIDMSDIEMDSYVMFQKKWAEKCTIWDFKICDFPQIIIFGEILGLVLVGDGSREKTLGLANLTQNVFFDFSD